MSMVTTKDGVEIFYKDWGPKNAQPIVFHHGWPLSADDWDTQMLYFVEKGYRVIAHDRRGHGRSNQVTDGHDMDHYAADAAAVVTHLGLRGRARPHSGHTAAARHRRSRAARDVRTAEPDSRSHHRSILNGRDLPPGGSARSPAHETAARRRAR